jgi:hypothetical protein
MSSASAADFRLERDRVVGYLQQQLIGPVDGISEELEGSPLDRYLLGVLYPQNTSADDVQKEEHGETNGSGDEESESESPISMAFERLPASMGLSFYVEGAESIKCNIWGAVYHLTAKEKSRERWKRESLGEPATPEARTLVRPKMGDLDKRIPVLAGRGALHSVWRPLGAGYLVTVTLMNQSVAEEGRPEPDACLFQSGFSCAANGGAISDYPRLVALRHDPEEEELALLYRGRRIFAIGHGCGAHWSGEGHGLVVQTAVMPLHEAFPVTREVFSAPEDARSNSFATVLSLDRLADEKIPFKTLCEELRQFVGCYGAWITGLEHQARGLGIQHAASSSRILERLKSALNRMKAGVSSLERDPVAQRAFRLATRAMIMQMVHSGALYGGVSRKRDEAKFVQPEYAGAAVSHLRWFPFQLAFMLLTVESISDTTSAERDIVDLIWFPTGGGKTEAYLWVAAFEMILRRLRHGDNGAGTAVIKRYTLRLLTSQQFQRAASLICACERLRATERDLGSEPFGLGLWIGGQSSANRFTDAKEQYENVLDDARPENPFQLQRCPWCGTRIIPEEQQPDPGFYGVRAEDTRFDFYCPSGTCPFHERIPVSVVDEEMYLRPPSMLIGTIDKFARLAWDDRASVFFGGHRLPPSLVIQDELHLISGPLGTIAGIYEAAIDCLLTRGSHRPKIIAATATIRRAKDQAERLYARPVSVFPPSGLDADDSYFARTDYKAVGRLYVGVMGQGHTPVTSVVRAAAATCQAPQEISALSDESKDGYWTLLIYHNSKRELGKTMALARDDIPARVQIIASDESNLRQIDNVEELSANVPGRRIPEVLLQLERRRGEEAIDILPCTNMISVGVDVKRLGVMMVVGQPKSTAEYIQATSRVGRDRVPGLVITMYSPTKPRDRSHYESFVSYHDALYRWVEPTSVTPFALPARERALHASIVILARHAAGMAANGAAEQFDPGVEPMKSLIAWLLERTARAEPAEAAATARHVEKLVDQWAVRAERSRKKQGSPLVYDGSAGPQFEPLICTFENPVQQAWRTLNSMRNVDSQSVIWVNGEKHD